MQMNTKKWLVQGLMYLSSVACYASQGWQMQTSQDKRSVDAETSAQAQLGQAKTKAYLRMSCIRSSGLGVGTRGIEFVVEDPSNFKDFHFEDFEGPDAYAGKRLTVQTMPGRVYQLKQAGFFQANTFVFGFSDLITVKQGLLERILADIAKGARVIEVQVADTRQAQKRWVARFDVDPSQVRFDQLMCQ